MEYLSGTPNFRYYLLPLTEGWLETRNIGSKGKVLAVDEVITEEPIRKFKGLILSVVLAAIALILAVAGALAVGENTPPVVAGILSISSRSSGVLTNISDFLPGGFAFGAGLVSSVNPCGFALLPAYLALYITSSSGPSESRILNRLGRALLVSAILTSGFVVLFGVVGLLITAGARQIITLMPWSGLVVGTVLTIVGAWILSGGNIYTPIAQRIARNLGDPTTVNAKGFFLFGISYGIASLSCTLPIFLAVLGIGVSTNSIFDSVGSFVVYALGMGSLILVLTTAIALVEETGSRLFRQALPYTHFVSAGLIIIAGSYVVFYWLTEGELLSNFV